MKVIVCNRVPIRNSPRAKIAGVDRNQVAGNGVKQVLRGAVIIGKREVAKNAGNALNVMISWRINDLEELPGITLHIECIFVMEVGDADGLQILLGQLALSHISLAILLEVSSTTVEQQASMGIMGG